MKTIPTLAFVALSIMVPVAVAHAQQTSLPKPPPLFLMPLTGKIPTDQWVYGDLQTLQDRKNIGLYPTRSFSHQAYTRLEFALHLEQELKTLDDTFDKEVKQHPGLLASLSILIQEFAPELRQRGTSLFVVEARINTLAQSVATGKFRVPFVEVPRKHWAYDAVEKLRQTGLIIGYPSGLFNCPEEKPAEREL